MSKSLVSVAVSLLLGIAGAILIQAFLIKPYLIPSASMQPTLDIGQRILVQRIDLQANHGDVVVFYPPVSAEKQTGCQQEIATGEICPHANQVKGAVPFIKRVAGLEGDLIEIKKGGLYRNGQLIDEPWASACKSGLGECTFTNRVRVAKDQVFVLGDNRDGSYDSRFWGTFPKEWLIGKSVGTYWPPSRWGS